MSIKWDRFIPKVNREVFSNAEWELLCHYGNQYGALQTGEYEPILAWEKVFVAVLSGLRDEADSIHASAWFKYLDRTEFESTCPGPRYAFHDRAASWFATEKWEEGIHFPRRLQRR